MLTISSGRLLIDLALLDHFCADTILRQQLPYLSYFGFTSVESEGLVTVRQFIYAKSLTDAW